MLAHMLTAALAQPPNQQVNRAVSSDTIATLSAGIVLVAGVSLLAVRRHRQSRFNGEYEVSQSELRNCSTLTAANHLLLPPLGLPRLLLTHCSWY